MKFYYNNNHIFILILIILTFLYFFWPDISSKNIISHDSSFVIKDLSEKLQKKSQKLGQLECEINSKDQVSNSGGWCSKISGLNSSEHATDKNLAIELSNFLKNKEVASFGDGPGAYKSLLTNLNQVKFYDAYDGAPFTELTTNDNVKFLDLSQPIYHLKKYDWIISLEVAEHIPAEFEQIYIDNLARHAKEGIILSWAKLGQGGHSHVNNRDISYVMNEMKKRNFILNKEKSDLFKNVAQFSWLKSNINVYQRVF